MNNKAINKCIHTSQDKYRIGIFGIIGGVVLLIIIFFLCYCIFFVKDNDITNIIGGIFSLILFFLFASYTFYRSIGNIILSKKIKNDINNNLKNSIYGKPYDIKISFSLPGVKNKCYSISNIRLIYKLDNELITLWIDKIFSTEKKIYKDTIIKLLKNETFDIFYLQTSKLITNPLQIEKIINSYIK